VVATKGERGVERKRMVGHHRHRICFSLKAKEKKKIGGSLFSRATYRTVMYVTYSTVSVAGWWLLMLVGLSLWRPHP
jgi:hypothetical protein